ncbi:MAG: zf-HC2 domain-containing protein [Treponematales bacterium]
MCPDRQFLSVYLDGELPSPWRERLVSHLEECPQCRARLEAYRSLSAAAREGDEAGVEAARERVWERLSARCRGFSGAGARRLYGPLWKRRVSLPVPAAVAAALAVFVLAAALVTARFPPFRSPDAAAGAAALEDQTLAPVPGMLQYLDGGADSAVLMLRLPEDARFVRPGKPTFIKAAALRQAVPR